MYVCCARAPESRSVVATAALVDAFMFDCAGIRLDLRTGAFLYAMESVVLL